MLRPTNLPLWCLRGTALVLGCWLIAALAPAAGAQETAATEEQADSVSSEDEADDDDLLQPSNTGYIDDAVVGSKIRLRYDSATGATKPDRAEFIYGKCTCFRGFGQDGASPGPAANLDFEEFELTYERAFSKRFSLFFEVPFRSIDLEIGPPAGPGQVDTSGLGDVRAGLKYALVAESDRYVTFQLRGYFASGDAEKALGTDHASIEPGLLYFSRPSERVTLSSEFRWWHPLAGSSDPASLASAPDGIRREVGTAPMFQPRPPADPFVDPRVSNDGYAGDVLRFGFGVSYEGRGERISVSPVAELVGWYVVDGWVFSVADGLEEADNDTIVNLKLGARISGKKPGSFYVGYGFALSHEDWYDGIFRFEYRLPLAAPKRHKAKMAAARAAEERAAADRAAAAKAAAEAEVKRAAAETAAREAEAKRAEAEAAAREAEAVRAQAEAAARAAEARRAEAEAAEKAATEEAEASAATHRVAATASPCLNLRPEPSLSVSRILCLEPGAKVRVLDQRDEWSRIRLEHGSEGWAVSRGLEPIG